MSIIQYIKHNEIDFSKWDNTIINSATPLVFAQSFYLNSTSPNWDALIYGDYECIFPITHKTKFGFDYLPQPPFTSQLGAFGQFKIEIEQEFINYINKYYKLIEIELNSSNKIHSKNISSKNTFVLDYTSAYSFNENTKRNIAKANKMKFEASLMDETELMPLYELHLKAFLKNTLKLNNYSLGIFKQILLNTNAVNKLAGMKVVDQKGEIKAIGYFVSNGKHAVYLKGCNFDKNENTGSMHLLLSYAIEYYNGKSNVFDFGGGSNSEGLAGFYSGLGGTKLNYSFLRINNLPWYIKVFK